MRSDVPDWLIDSAALVAKAPYLRHFAIVPAHPNTESAMRAHVVYASGAEFDVDLEIKRSPLSGPTVDGWIALNHEAHRPRLLAADAISSTQAERLRAEGLSFIDGRGSCFLNLGASSPIIDHWRTEGPRTRAVRAVVSRKPSAESSWPTRAAPSNLRVLFSLLACPSNRRLPMRELAKRAASSYQSVARTLAALRDDDTFERTGRSAHRLVAKDRLANAIDRFVLGWRHPLRTQQHLITLRSTREPEADETEVEALLSANGQRFAFGGSAGAHRLSPFYRGATTLVHIDGDWQSEWNRSLRAAPSRDGNIIVMRTLGMDDIEPDLPIAHPLLLYAELRTSDDAREREFAQELRPLVEQRALEDE